MNRKQKVSLWLGTILADLTIVVYEICEIARVADSAYDRIYKGLKWPEFQDILLIIFLIILTVITAFITLKDKPQNKTQKLKAN